MNILHDSIVKRFAFPLLFFTVMFCVEAADISFLNDSSVTDEVRINRLKDIDGQKLNQEQISTLIAFSKSCEPTMAMGIFKVLQKRDGFEDMSLLFLKSRFSGSRETAENLNEYLNALKSLYMSESPEMQDDPIKIYNKLAEKLSIALEVATPYNRALLISNREAVNALLISGKSENIFPLLPALIEYKWQEGDELDGMMFQALCNVILDFQDREYPLPEDVFKSLEAASEDTDDKALAELIQKIVDKRETERRISRELTINDLKDTTVDVEKRRKKLLEILRATDGTPFTADPDISAVMKEILFDDKQEDSIRQRLVSALWVEMEKDAKCSNVELNGFVRKAIEKFKDDSPTLFRELVLSMPVPHLRLNEQLLSNLAYDKDVPLPSRAALLFLFSQRHRPDKRRLKNAVLQALDEQCPEPYRAETRDLLVGTLQTLTGKDLFDATNEQIKEIVK